MADYLELKRTTSSTDSGFWINGTGLFSVQGVYNTVYRCAYYANTLYNIRVGVYRNFDRYNFVFVSENIINPIDIRLVFVNANDETIVVRTIDRIDTDFDGGYRNGFAITLAEPIISINIFNSLSECLNAIGFKREEIDADIIVTVSPNSSGRDNIIVVDIGGTVEDSSQITVNIDGKYEQNDTNAQGGISTTGGGHGTFDDTSDIVPIPPMPLLSATGCGLVTLFRPSLSELQALGSYLWTNITDFIENLNKLFMNPMDYIISLNIFPCNPSVSDTRRINIGSVTTSISMPPVSSQWYEFNCGTINIREYWGSALDYAPNTKISLFLPFIGSVQINTDEVMGKIMGIKYRIDLLSGQCVAMVTVADNPTQVGTVYYQYTGECAVSVPLTGADWSRIYSAAIGAIGTAITGGIAAGASGAAAGGATAALAGARASEAMSMAGQNFAMINETSKGVRGVQEMRNRMLEAAEIASNAARQAAASPTQVGNAIKTSRIANTISNTVGQVISGKGHISHTGTISGSAGMLGVKVPYVILEFPNQSLADNYKHFVGYPSNLSGKLGDFTGYTECEQVIPVGFTGTDDELAELLDALKGGVYL